MLKIHQFFCNHFLTLFTISKTKKILSTEFIAKNIIPEAVIENPLLQLDSVHPETPDEKQSVSCSESGDFFFWQGNRGVARRRTEVRRTRRLED